MTKYKQYIGDGVYVDVDGYGGLVLTTEDGISTTNTIYIEAGVYRALQRWINWVKEQNVSDVAGDNA